MLCSVPGMHRLLFPDGLNSAAELNNYYERTFQVLYTTAMVSAGNNTFASLHVGLLYKVQPNEPF